MNFVVQPGLHEILSHKTQQTNWSSYWLPHPNSWVWLALEMNRCVPGLGQSVRLAEPLRAQGETDSHQMVARSRVTGGVGPVHKRLGRLQLSGC